MIKIIKMELYRFFRSSSTWVILFADIILAFLSVMLVQTMINNNASIPIYANAWELLAAQINGGILMVLCALSAIIFVSAKYKNGFIKNTANLVSRRELLLFPEIIVTAIASALHFFVYSACTIGAWAVLLGNTFIPFSFSAIIKLLIVQYILHLGFCCLLLLIYMLTNSTTFTMIAGLLISFKVMNIFYALVEQLTHFNFAQYMLDYNIFQIGIESAEPRAAVVGVIFLLAEIVLLCLVMNKKDIR